MIFKLFKYSNNNYNLKKVSDATVGCYFFWILILVLIFIANVLLNYFKVNTRTAFPIDSESCMTNQLPFCNLSDDHQFEKFIHLGVDGVSWLFIDDMRNLLHEHSHEYITYTDEIRYTSEILKTWFSGRDNNKLNIKRLSGDHLFSSFKRKYGAKIHLYGSLSDFNNVLDSFDGLFWKTTNKVDIQPWKTHRAFSFWIAEPNRSVFLKQLNEWNDNNISLVSFTADTDHVQHLEGGNTNVYTFMLYYIILYLNIYFSYLILIYIFFSLIFHFLFLHICLFFL